MSRPSRSQRFTEHIINKGKCLGSVIIDSYYFGLYVGLTINNSE